MNRTCAIVVTYNRLELLKEVLDALLNVEDSLDKIIVVNNASTDQTHLYLEELQLKNLQIEELLLEKNIGGAGGFYSGIEHGYSEGYDYLWLMDDDSVVTPDSLKFLKEPFNQIDNIGFTCSRVLWKDYHPHLMNIPDVRRENLNGIPFFEDPGYINVNSCSFVSMLISREVVQKCGLPYKDFFIWCDDLEYSRRIIKRGLKGLFCEKSVVIHKTPNNYSTNIQNCSTKEFWKMRYGFRNRTFMYKNFREYDLMIIHFLKNIIRALQRKDHKAKALGLVFTSFFRGITFKPNNG